MRVLKGVFFLFSLVLFINLVSAQDVYDCQTLNAENGLYVLQNDVLAGGSCFVVGANNVSIDLSGYKVVGNGNGVGLLSEGFSHVSITGGTIKNFMEGVHFSSSSYNHITNNVLSSNSKGIYFDPQSYFNEVDGNDVINNAIGISIFSSDNKIYHNNFIENTIQANSTGTNTWDLSTSMGGNHWGDYDSGNEHCGDSDRDGVCDNPYVVNGQNRDNFPVIDSNGWLCIFPEDGSVFAQDTKFCLGSYSLPHGVILNHAGITLDCNYAYLYSSDGGTGIKILEPNVTLKNCFISSYDVGIESYSGGHIFNNSFFNLPGIGIRLQQDNNLVTNNKFQSTFVSVLVENSNNNVISENLVDGEGSSIDYGFKLARSKNNILANNTVRFANNAGIYLFESSFNTLTQNYISSNSQGIYLDGRGTLKNNIYNNFVNNSINVVLSNGNPNYFNTYLHLGKNIIGGKFLGGNFWAQPNGRGFSETCKDRNFDGICDNQYALGRNNFDEFPLTIRNMPMAIRY